MTLIDFLIPLGVVALWAAFTIGYGLGFHHGISPPSRDALEGSPPVRNRP